MGKRLARYRFTWLSGLDRDHTRQDTLTTWVVYLAYEYRFQDQDASYIKFSQCRHDEAWEKLVDSSVLRNGETYGAVCDIERCYETGVKKERLRRICHPQWQLSRSMRHVKSKWRLS